MKKPTIISTNVQVKDIGEQFTLVSNDTEICSIMEYFGFTDKRYKNNPLPRIKKSFDSGYGFAFVDIQDGEYNAVYLGTNCVPFNDKYLHQIIF